jgi:hypothetical protein
VSEELGTIHQTLPALYIEVISIPIVQGAILRQESDRLKRIGRSELLSSAALARSQNLLLDFFR